MIDKLSNKFRGFGFVSYHTPLSEEDDGKARVLEYQNGLGKPHIIRGKQIEVREALSKEESRKKLEEEKKRKLFCIHLS